MTRMVELQARRRRLLADCELQRDELAARLGTLRQSPLSRAAAALLSPAAAEGGGALPVGKPLALAAALASVVLLRRPRQLFTVIALARQALRYGARAAFMLRLFDQVRGRLAGARRGR